jgi:Kef-type K+ transport system membrane component KefB
VNTLKANLALSALVAAIGISAPIALSFVLQSMLVITPLQAFAAGAALCSTSLGTTFTVLGTTGLIESRLGVVLTSAAMIDDVAGLIMIQVISNLGTNPSFDWTTVVRPIGVSIAFAVAVPLGCVYVAKPLVVWTASMLRHTTAETYKKLLDSRFALFVSHTLVLIALVAGSSYAGTSNLFAAYLAGASISWLSESDQLSESQSSTEGHQEASIAQSTASADLKTPTSSKNVDGQVPVETTTSSIRQRPEGSDPATQAGKATTQAKSNAITAVQQHTNAENKSSSQEIFERYCTPALNTILKPFFFASIGFSIPVTQMFRRQIIWRGFVFAVLMTLAKMLCGSCLVRFKSPNLDLSVLKTRFTLTLSRCFPFPLTRTAVTDEAQSSTPSTDLQEPSLQESARNDRARNVRSRLPKPQSLYPAAILGSAMVARGEIGFLISSVAQSTGVFSGGAQASGTDLFLVVTWAIIICTVLGPVTLGLLVRRVKRLQEIERDRKTGKEDPLGIWGIVPSTNS